MAGDIFNGYLASITILVFLIAIVVAPWPIAAGLCLLLTALLVSLKLARYIGWPWASVLFPTLGPLATAAALAAIREIIAFVAQMESTRN